IAERIDVAKANVGVPVRPKIGEHVRLRQCRLAVMGTEQHQAKSTPTHKSGERVVVELLHGGHIEHGKGTRGAAFWFRAAPTQARERVIPALFRGLRCRECPNASSNCHEEAPLAGTPRAEKGKARPNCPGPRPPRSGAGQASRTRNRTPAPAPSRRVRVLSRRAA